MLLRHSIPLCALLFVVAPAQADLADYVKKAEPAYSWKLKEKKEGGTVSGEWTQPPEESRHVEVTEDGIGRAHAESLKSKSVGNSKSFGMQVTADRIRMINERYNTHTQAQIFDLVAPDGEPLGTKVVLDIPV